MTTSSATIVGWPELIAHRRFLVHFARRKLHDPNLAEDAVHDVFEAVMTNRAHFDGHSALRSWLVGALKHKLVDLIRDRARHRSLESIREDADACELDRPRVDWPSPDPGPEQIVEHRLRLRHTLACIDKLSLPLRRAVELRLLHDRPTAEVCEALQISPGNLFVCLHRARQQLAVGVSVRGEASIPP